MTWDTGRQGKLLFYETKREGDVHTDLGSEIGWGGTSPGSTDVNSALMTFDFPGSPSVPELMVVDQGP